MATGSTRRIRFNKVINKLRFMKLKHKNIIAKNLIKTTGYRFKIFSVCAISVLKT